MEIKVRMSAGAIGNAVLEVDSSLCRLRALGRMGRIDIEGTLVSPEKDAILIADWMGQPSGPIMVRFGDMVIPIEIAAIKDLLIVA